MLLIFSTTAVLAQAPKRCQEKGNKPLTFQKILDKSQSVQTPCPDFVSKMQEFQERAQDCITHTDDINYQCAQGTGEAGSPGEFTNGSQTVIDAARSNNNAILNQYHILKNKLDVCASKLISTLETCNATYKWASGWGGSCHPEQAGVLVEEMKEMARQSDAIGKICRAFDNLHIGRRQQISARQAVKESRKVYEEVSNTE